jgi:hypothetical protein
MTPGNPSCGIGAFSKAPRSQQFADTAARVDSRNGTVIGTVNGADQIRFPNTLIFNELWKASLK